MVVKSLKKIECVLNLKSSFSLLTHIVLKSYSDSLRGAEGRPIQAAPMAEFEMGVKNLLHWLSENM